MTTTPSDAQVPPIDDRAPKSNEQPQGASIEPEALGLEPEVCAKITSHGSSVRDVAIALVTKDGNEKSYVYASDIEKGLRQYEISEGGSIKLPFWQYASKEKGPVRMKKGGIVSSVCTLADGRVAVGIIDRRRVLLLRWLPAKGDSSISSTAGSWSVVQKIKLRCDPYRIDALGSDILAVAGTEAEQKPVSFLGSSSKWGPGPHVAIAYLNWSPVKLVQCGELMFKAVAVSLANAVLEDQQTDLLVAASSDAVQADKSSELWSYVVEAYDLPQPPVDDKSRSASGSGQKPPPPALKMRWSCKFDEQVQDVCAVSRKVAVYVVLPDSRRVAALDLRTGHWLVDVLDCGSSRPIRIDIAPRGGRSSRPIRDGDKEDEGKSGGGDLGKMKAAILYADSSVSIHRVAYSTSIL